MNKSRIVQIWWLSRRLPIPSDIQKLITRRLADIVANVCECSGIHEYVNKHSISITHEYILIKHMNAGQWCFACKLSTPYTYNNMISYSRVFKHGERGWYPIIGTCICEYLSPADLMGHATCFELNFHLKYGTLAPCRHCGDRYQRFILQV